MAVSWKFLNYEKIKNKCNSLVRKPKKEYFQNVSNVRHFEMLSSLLCQIKGPISNENIVIKAQKKQKIKVKGLENQIHIDANELIKDDKTLV